ncbi:1428_t:CDS:1 [Gigaspora margarita]|uniref:1428_t:CDS:1 n=1 Tax=Gigaspora margarita TaxID=4874 RepID=A0ABN7X663_GIGMA|nr:1428_t:CDS:1 [Gigaspora margarita]
MALKNILPVKDQKLWAYFANAVSIMSQRIITLEEINSGHNLFIKFLKEFEKLYGSNIITPNMHYHLHLKDDMLNFGSWYSYWCFAYKRLNGQIANIHTSGRSIELDMLNYINQQIEIYELLNQVKPTLSIIAQTSLDQLQNKQLVKGTLAMYNYSIPKIIEFQDFIKNINYYANGSENFPGKLIKPYFEAYLNNNILNLLVDYYTEAYSTNNLKFYAEGKISTDSNSYLVSKRILRASALEFCNEYFTSGLNRSDLGAYFIALFKNKNEQAIHWPGKINYFLQHTLLLPAKYSNNNIVDKEKLIPIHHTLCFVDWFKQSSINQKNHFLILNDLNLNNKLPLAEIWEPNFQNRSYENFFPVQKILCRFVRGNYKLNNQTKVVILPLNHKLAF